MEKITAVECFLILTISGIILLAIVFKTLTSIKKAEIIGSKYGLTCHWYNLDACEDMLEYEEGKNKDFKVELIQN